MITPTWRGQVGALERAGQPAFVDHGEHIADLLARPHAATLGPVRRPRPGARRTAAERAGTATQVTAASG